MPESAQSSFFPEEQVHDPGGKVKLPVPAHWKAHAEFSGPKKEFRSFLEYRWAMGATILVALMNPSVAGVNCLDPTLAKCGRLAQKWAYAGFGVVNACDYRCTDSKLLRYAPCASSPENLPTIKREARRAALILVGYGKLHKSLQPHAAAMVEALRSAGKPLHVLALNGDGSPSHPLYLSEDTLPVEWKL